MPGRPLVLVPLVWHRVVRARKVRRAWLNTTRADRRNARRGAASADAIRNTAWTFRPPAKKAVDAKVRASNTKRRRSAKNNKPGAPRKRTPERIRGYSNDLETW